ncbi:hypothetical protein D9Q98_002803 [Chlorella vulgaris]|uniref:Variant-specific surface protein n=1 Tax=Chlorella vulgaris TaxID=3077 RepID=A0A9D4TUK3_CHLVU|nr:hypothetical protein D9Q98_002803 [Chlorella vulgaris]
MAALGVIGILLQCVLVYVQQATGVSAAGAGAESSLTPCPQNCQACNYKRCTQCMSTGAGLLDHYPNAKGECRRCAVAGCDLSVGCTTLGRCKACLQGYTLESGTCINRQPT